MTQAELNSIAQKMRSRDPNYSWMEAFIFAKDVVGGLAHAYQALLKNSMIPNKTTPSDVQNVVRDKLAAMLTLLTSEAQVARWESKVLAGNNSFGAQEAGNTTV